MSEEKAIYLTEMFGPTLQGEGMWAGTMSAFVRTAGCTVGCKPCDTKQSWPFGSHVKKPHPLVPVSKIVEAVNSWGVPHTVITGGEPMETENPEALAELVDRLADFTNVTIELSGSIKPPEELWETLLSRVSLWSFSPKVSSMAPVKPPNLDFVIGVLGYVGENELAEAQLKFVVDPDCPTSLQEIGEFLRNMSTWSDWTPPLYLQVLTKPDSIRSVHSQREQILQDQRRLFEKVHACKDDWGLWSPQQARITCQQHVLVGVR